MTWMHKLARRLAGCWPAAFPMAAATLVACAAETAGPAHPPSDPTLTTLVVTPPVASTAAGQAVSFSAFGRTAGNDSVPVPVAWSASGGSVTAAGVFTAGQPGTYQVVASVVVPGGQLADSAVVTVSAAPPPPPPPSLVAVIVTPSSATADTGVGVQFRAYGRDAQGDSVAVGVTWLASGGAGMTQGGVFTGHQAGSYQVIGVATGGILADTATVTVTAPPPPPPSLAAVIVTPPSASADTGVAVPFQAYGRNSLGDSVAVGVTWSASGGASMTQGGVFTGHQAGSHRVIAVVTGGILADTATVTVTAPPPPPPPGLVNECANPQPGWIWCDDFDQNRLASYFEYDSRNGAFTRANGAGNGGSWGMKAVFSAGQTDAGFLHLAFGRTPQAYFRPVDAGTATYREIYWRWYFRAQPGWQGGGGDKMSRATSFASGSSWAQAMFGHVWSGSGQFANLLAIDPASGTDPAGNLVTTTYNDFPNMRWLGIARSQTPVFDPAHAGQWYCVEARVKLNDAGQSNGLMELWIDGVLEASRTGLNWVGAFSAYGINAVFLENYWNAGSPVQQERYFDNFVVSTQRVGC